MAQKAKVLATLATIYMLALFSCGVMACLSEPFSHQQDVFAGIGLGGAALADLAIIIWAIWKIAENCTHASEEASDGD